MERTRKFLENKCMRCHKYFHYSVNIDPAPHLCPVCSDFFKKFNSKGKDKTPQESRPPAKIVTKSVTD